MIILGRGVLIILQEGTAKPAAMGLGGEPWPMVKGRGAGGGSCPAGRVHPAHLSPDLQHLVASHIPPGTKIS